MRKTLRLGVACLAIVVVLSLMMGMIVAEAALHPGRHLLTNRAGTEARTMAQRHDAELTEIAISAVDGVRLRAWGIFPKHSNGSAVVLMHGVADNRSGMLGYAELLLSDGFDVILPDSRAHGASGGQLATYGLLESDDIHRWFDWVQQNRRPICIFGFGESMGAAQLLQALEVEPRFCAVVAESPFSSFREISYLRIGQTLHTGPWVGRTLLRPAVEAAFLYGRWKYNLNFERASPEEAVAATPVPVLLIHGYDDRNIPVVNSRRIARRNPAVDLWEVPNADHCGAASTAPDEFNRRVLRWFDGHSKSGRVSEQRVKYDVTAEKHHPDKGSVSGTRSN